MGKCNIRLEMKGWNGLHLLHQCLVLGAHHVAVAAGCLPASASVQSGPCPLTLTATVGTHERRSAQIKDFYCPPHADGSQRRAYRAVQSSAKMPTNGDFEFEH